MTEDGILVVAVIVLGFTLFTGGLGSIPVGLWFRLGGFITLAVGLFDLLVDDVGGGGMKGILPELVETGDARMAKLGGCVVEELLWL